MSREAMPKFHQPGWSSVRTEIQSGQVLHYRLEEAGKALSFRRVLQLLEKDKAFRAFYNQVLADSPFSGFFWEHPPVTHSTLDRSYAFVLVRGDALASLIPDPGAFAEHFQGGEPVVVFSNLRGDARLIVPAPQGDHPPYAHLAAFARQASEALRDIFWQRVSEEYRRSLSSGKRWLSTAGMGVPWLHVRVDAQPKYYRYEGFTRG